MKTAAEKVSPVRKSRTYGSAKRTIGDRRLGNRMAPIDSDWVWFRWVGRFGCEGSRCGGEVITDAKVSG